MSPADRPAFASALTPLFAAYGKRLDSDQANAYWTYLEDLPLGMVLDGLVAAGRVGGRYLPSVGQIREAIAAEAGGPRDTRALPGCDDCTEGWVLHERAVAADEAVHPYGPRAREWRLSWVTTCGCLAGQAKHPAGGAS